FTSPPPDEEPRVAFEPPTARFRAHNPTARFRAQSWRRGGRRGRDDVISRDDDSRPRPPYDADYDLPARARAGGRNQWNNDDYQIDYRHYDPQSYTKTRQDKWSHENNTNIRGRAARNTNSKGEIRENRYFPNKQINYFPDDREFINSKYKRQETYRETADDRKIRSLPRQNPNTPLSYDNFEDVFPKRKTKRKNKKRVRSRYMMEDRGGEFYGEEDELEYDAYVQEEEEERFDTQFARPHTYSLRDTYVESSRSMASRGHNAISYANRAGRDIRIEQPPERVDRQRDRESRPPLPRKRQNFGGGPKRYFQKQTNNKSNYIPASPRLRTAMKLMYDLIRLVHHLEKVTTKITNNSPITFKRLTRLLTNSIKPAMPNDAVKKLLEDNAQNWSTNAQVILEQHYEKLIDSTLTELKERTDQAHWFQAFQTATNWATKNFGRRISSEVFERAEALFTAETCNEYDRKQQEKDHRQAAAVEPPKVLLIEPDTHTQAHPVVRPKKGVSHIHVEIQTSPRRWEDGRIPASPPPMRSDWSFDQEFPPLEPKPDIQPTPALPQRPPPKRVRRRIITEEIDGDQEPQVEATEMAPEIPDAQDVTKKTFTEDLNVEKLKHYEELTDILVQEGILKRGEEVVVTEEPKRTHIEAGPSTSKIAPSSLKVEETKKSLPSLSRIQSPPLFSSDDSLEYQFSEYSVSSLTRDTPTKVTEKEGGQKIIVRPKEGERTTQSLQIDETEQTPKKQVTIAAPPTPRSVGRPYRHINTDRKQIDWSLNLKKKYVIIGDSNVSRIPAFNISDLQIDSFPGAKFQHAGNLIEKATIAMEPEVLLLSFGLNNRSQRCFTSTNKEIQRAYRVARARFPHTEIVVPMVNYCDLLPIEEQGYLDEINQYIKDNLNFIQLLPVAQFQ
ncbi:hypothetical protein M9458_039244, partial [Cirrhinus mrigala]